MAYAGRSEESLKEDVEAERERLVKAGWDINSAQEVDGAMAAFRDKFLNRRQLGMQTVHTTQPASGTHRQRRSPAAASHQDPPTRTDTRSLPSLGHQTAHPLTPLGLQGASTRRASTMRSP